MEKIAILGMGPIGASIGLALKSVGLKNTQVVGFASSKSDRNAISKMNAFDHIESNMKSVVSEAQLVLIDATVSRTREILELISEFVEPGSVVTDTCTSKVRTAAWAKEFLPQGVSYVGGRPIIKAKLDGISSSSHELLRGARYCVMPSETTDDQATKTIVGMVEAIGSQPYFLDPSEHDSYSSAVDILPSVISAAFVDTTANSDSWSEMYKVAGEYFESQSNMAAEDPVEAETNCLTLSDPLVYWIDQMILSLHKFRTHLNEDDDDLVDSFVSAWEQRAKWEIGAVGKEQSGPRLPSAGETMATSFLGDKLAKRLIYLEDKEKRASWKYPGKR